MARGLERRIMRSCPIFQRGVKRNRAPIVPRKISPPKGHLPFMGQKGDVYIVETTKRREL